MENRFGSIGRSTIGAIYGLERLKEKYIENRRDLHAIFIDLEQACNKVSREVVGLALVKADTCI